LVERSFQSLAKTDVSAALEYEDAVRAYHAQLRAWYYPKLFGTEEFDGDQLMSLSSSPRLDVLLLSGRAEYLKKTSFHINGWLMLHRCGESETSRLVEVLSLESFIWLFRRK